MAELGQLYYSLESIIISEIVSPPLPPHWLYKYRKCFKLKHSPPRLFFLLQNASTARRPGEIYAFQFQGKLIALLHRICGKIEFILKMKNDRGISNAKNYGHGGGL